MKKFFLLTVFIPMTFTVWGQTEQVYKIGDIGQAGGIVFYDKGSYSDGWRYLEVAPVETERVVLWQKDRRDIRGTKAEIGTGKQNTKLIIEYIERQKQEVNTAAQACIELTYNGFKDWFLPSKDEFFVIYNTLIRRGLGEFDARTWYWTSTQHNNFDAIATDTNGGGQFPRSKNDVNYNIRVRAIRAF